jgi:hypothetical protein
MAIFGSSRGLVPVIRDHFELSELKGLSMALPGRLIARPAISPHPVEVKS